jgi:hypothetical protein
MPPSWIFLKYQGDSSGYVSVEVRFDLASFASFAVAFALDWLFSHHTPTPKMRQGTPSKSPNITKIIKISGNPVEMDPILKIPSMTSFHRKTKTGGTEANNRLLTRNPCISFPFFTLFLKPHFIF